MQLRAYFDYDSSSIVVMVIPGAGTDEWNTDPIVKALSVQIHGSGEILRKPFTLDGIEVYKTRGIVAELTELHNKSEDWWRLKDGKPMPVCEHCRELCHSHSGLSCDDEGDGAWPCATMAIVEKYAK